MEIVVSKSNAIVAVVLPNESGSYSYYLESKNCCKGVCVIHHIDRLFSMIRKNKFNFKESNKNICDTAGYTLWFGESSYIETVKWVDFIANHEFYIQNACSRNDNIDDYIICKDV